MHPLDIAFVTETFPPEINGVAMTLGRLVQALDARGHHVEVMRPRQRRGDTGGGRELALPGLPLPGYRGLRFGLPAGARLAREWRRRRPDLVHVATEGPLGWSAVGAARRLGIPVTSSFHTKFDQYSLHYGVGWLRPAVAAYLRALHSRTAVTMVPTAALAAELATAGLPTVRVVGRGVDTRLFDPQRRDEALRTDWGVATGALACLYVGRLAPEKNLAAVERAFAAIAARHPGARMVWVGDGPCAPRLRQAWPDHHFAGVQHGVELARHYASADLFLFPSLTETYGNVVAEAMASGVPVVAYRCAAAAELIAQGENGATVAPGDEAAFVDAALALLADDEGRAGVRSLARRRMLSQSWDVVVEAFERIAAETVAGRARAGRVAAYAGGFSVVPR